MTDDASRDSDLPPPSERLPPRRMFAAGEANPFGDGTPNTSPDSATPASDNLFASPGDLSRARLDPENHEAVLQHRGNIVLTFGIVGFLGATVGSVFLYFCCLPFPFFALAVTLPAWLMGRMDLQAMNAGAMDSSGRTATRIGHILGIIGTLVGMSVTILAAGYLLSMYV